LAPEFYI